MWVFPGVQGLSGIQDHLLLTSPLMAGPKEGHSSAISPNYWILDNPECTRCPLELLLTHVVPSCLLVLGLSEKLCLSAFEEL